ncbi:TPA: zonular occludens toxin family protein, partial [Salmonella enterica]|nr:zonular occludens toxin family protein [Salmonella enterica]
MTVKWVTGKLGAGKGLYCDYEMVKYYREGRRVVTNYPVDTHLLDPDSVNPVMVLPAHPRPQDL